MRPTRLMLSKAVIPAVEGYAVADGRELSLWCDLRVAVRDAVFGVYCRRFGVSLMDLGTMRLPRLIGHSRAMGMILTGRGASGGEAKRNGVAIRLTAPGQALAVALQHAPGTRAAPAGSAAQRPAIHHSRPLEDRWNWIEATCGIRATGPRSLIRKALLIEQVVEHYASRHVSAVRQRPRLN